MYVFSNLTFDSFLVKLVDDDDVKLCSLFDDSLVMVTKEVFFVKSEDDDEVKLCSLFDWFKLSVTLHEDELFVAAGSSTDCFTTLFSVGRRSGADIDSNNSCNVTFPGNNAVPHLESPVVHK